MGLNLESLRKANVERCEEVFHPLNDWTPTDWATAMGGEAGETLNKVKKLRRLDDADKAMDTPEERKRICALIAEEIADTVIYGDLLAALNWIIVERQYEPPYVHQVELRWYSSQARYYFSDSSRLKS